MNAYLLGKGEMQFGKEVLYGRNAQQQGMSVDVIDQTRIPNHSDIQEVLNDRGEFLLPNISHKETKQILNQQMKIQHQ